MNSPRACTARQLSAFVHPSDLPVVEATCGRHQMDKAESCSAAWTISTDLWYHARQPHEKRGAVPPCWPSSRTCPAEGGGADGRAPSAAEMVIQISRIVTLKSTRVPSRLSRGTRPPSTSCRRRSSPQRKLQTIWFAMEMNYIHPESKEEC